MLKLVDRLLATGVALVALMILAAWIVDQNLLKHFSGTLIFMVSNTALCFALASAALLFTSFFPKYTAPVLVGVGCVLIAFSVAVVTQDIFAVNFGIDEMLARVKLTDFNLNPGRMAPPTSSCFILSGFLLLLLSRRRSNAENVLLQTLVLIILIVAIVAITAVSIRLELLYDWYRFGRMALPTGVCFVALAAAIWLRWYAAEAREGGFLDREDKRVSVAGVIVIVGVALAAGMAGFGLLANQMEQTLEFGLRETFDNQDRLIEDEINAGIATAVPLTSRILLNKALIILNQRSDDASLENIKQDAESFIGPIFQRVDVYKADGDLVASVGKTDTSDLKIALQSPRPDTELDLLWMHGGAVLHVSMAIRADGTKIGSIAADVAMPNLGSVLTSPDLLGETAETRLCYAESDQLMRCLPSNRRLDPFPSELRADGYGVKSMDLALRSERGLRVARDYLRHQVVTVYGPVGAFGLGLVVKIDTVEFYGPLRSKLEYAFLLVMLLSGMGVAIQRAQLVPLVTRLIKSEERNELAIKGLSAGLWDWDLRQSKLSWSPRFLQILGLRREDFVPHTDTFIERVHPDDRDRARTALQNHVNVKAPYDIEYRLRHESGEYIWVRSTGQAKWGADGAATRMVGSVTDISELKVAEHQLKQLISKLTESNTELERFAYVASHDMQEPLRMITSFGSLIESEFGDKLGEEGNEYLRIVTESSKRMLMMVQDLLEYAQVGNDGVRFAKTDVANELEHVKENLEGAIKDSHAVITSDHLPIVWGNPVQIMRLLQNLVGNGLKYQAAGVVPRVHVGVASAGMDWRFSVKDNGIGIEAAYIEAVFEPFKRLHTWQDYKGTGMGLSVCKKIVETHGGKIWITSEPGQGTTMWFTIPKRLENDGIKGVM